MIEVMALPPRIGSIFAKYFVPLSIIADAVITHIQTIIIPSIPSLIFFISTFALKLFIPSINST